MSERLILAGLVAAVVAAAVWVQAGADASLLARPDRAEPAPVHAGIQIGSAAFPRRAVGADGVVTTIAQPPRRIVSQYWSIDEYLYAIVPPERIVGVSETAYLPVSSNLLDVVNRFRPVVATEPEAVLRADPDLVIAGEATRWEVSGVIRQAGVPVHRVHTRFETLQSIAEHMRLIGYLTGEDDRAEVAVRRFEDRIAAAAARRPVGRARPRVLGMGGLYTFGAATLFSDILRELGAENVASTHGLIGYQQVTDEHIVRWDPDWIVVGADRGQEDVVRARLLARPAVAATAAARHGRVVVVTNDVFQPLSPFTATFVERLAEVFYGEAGDAR